MTRQDLIDKYGFKIIPHFTVTNNVTLDLGRNRYMSIASVGTPNELMVLAETDPDNFNITTDIVILWNYDYDGYLTEGKLELILKFFNH